MQLLTLFFISFCQLILAAEPLENTLTKAFCLYRSGPQNYQDTCHENSISINCSTTTTRISHLVQLNQTLKTPQLICKSIKEISLSWDHSGFSSNFLELSHIGSAKNRNYTKPTTCNRWILSDLQPDTSYKIRRWKVWIENSTHFFEFSTPALLVKTGASVDSLLPISGFEVKNLSLNGDGYDATVTWIPAPDMPCRYRLDAFGVTNGDHISKGVAFPFPPYEERISGLKFGHTYNITIRALSPSLSSPFAESPPSYTVVDMPSCLATYSNLTICVPPPPENVTVSAKCRRICDVTVSWSIPELTPDAYLIYIYDFNDDGNDIINITVPGTASSATLNNIAIDTYEVIVRAVSQAGKSAATVETFTINPDDSAADVTTKLAVVLGVLTTTIALLILLIVLKRRHARKFRSQINNLYSKELLKFDGVLAKPTSKKVVDEWEVTAENIVFEDVLGEGAFGLVKKGVLKKHDGQVIVVGVKMLKPHASSEEARQLFQEITIMKSVGAHPNLVSMIGCVTEGSVEGPLLLVEFCPNGDLQTFLRKEWERLNNFYRDTNQAASEENNYNVLNKAYVFDNTEEFITPNDLLSFARQIALGMEHLSKLRVLHRDLAARNVLVCDNKLVKVADFGLSRDVYQNNVYWKLGGGKLPIRWMALESITHQRYTTQSDVWSFGVLLWEIVTLGEHPYPEVNNADLLNFLKRGCRMEKPPHCGLELYQIMLNCWKENAKERPSFTEIRRRLEVLLEDALNYVKL